MSDTRIRGGAKAFTLAEFMVVVAVMAVLAMFLVPSAIKAKQKAQRISCISNLKCVGFSFRQWANDNTNLYPMQLSTELGGTKERIVAGETFRHFEVMSNELNTPMILVCPSDSARIRVRNFSPSLNNSNISYFVGLDAEETQPQTLLMGDRNIFTGVRPLSGVVELTTNNVRGWGRGFHRGQGNVAFADGSVQGLSSNLLYQAVANSGLATNRLQLP